MKTQKTEVLKYLENHPEGLTQLQAANLFGAQRLGAIIHTLRHKDGYNIITKTKTVKTRYGGHSNVAVYQLKENIWEETQESQQLKGIER